MYLIKFILTVTVVFCVHNSKTCHAYRILGIFPVPAPSHYFLGGTLMKGLAEAGHNITIITAFKEQNLPKNGSWREIHLEILENINMGSSNYLNILNMVSMMKSMTTNLTMLTITHPEVQKLMKSDEKFDAVIITEFLLEALKVFAFKFDAHLITFNNHGALHWYHDKIGNVILPSCYSEAMLAFPTNMNFFQRLINFYAKLALKIFLDYFAYSVYHDVAEKYFPGSPELNEITRNVSLVLVNSHISLYNARPTVPVMIDIGGFHLQPPKKLPEDLQKLLDSAKQGVIYFSMGSNFKSEDLQPEKLDAILKSLSKRKEKVLWKWGQDTFPNKSSNVHISKWFPQQDILAHPNVKLFVTHGGFLSTTETVSVGVPIVAIPLFGDQKFNAKSAEREGYGIAISLDDLSEDNFSRAIEEVLSNPSYAETAREKSKIFHDRQNPPLQDAIYWVEYVIRHNGAKHLRVPYLNLRWYEYFLVDVIAFSFASLFVVLYILKKIVGFVFRKCFSSKPKVKTS